MNDAEAADELLGDVEGRTYLSEEAESEEHFPLWHDLGDPIAMHWEEDFRRLFVDSAINALEVGVEAEEVFGFGDYLDSEGKRWIVNPGSAERELLEGDLRRAKRKLTNAKAAITEAQSDHLRQDFVKTADRLALEVERIEADLSSLESKRDGPTAAESFDADIDFLLRALARVLDGTQKATADEVLALQRIVTDTSVRDVAATEVEYRYHLLIPTSSTVLKLGPIDFKVPNRIEPLVPGNEGCLWPLAEKIMDEPTAELKKRPVTTVRRFIRMRLASADYGDLPTKVLSLCHVPEVAVAVARDLGFDALPAGDPDFERWIIDTYRDPGFRWRPMFYALNPVYRQAALDHLADLGVATSRQLADLVGGADASSQIGQMANERPSRETVVPAVLERSTQDGEDGARAYQLRSCPHCAAPLTFYCMTPETAVGGLLCDSCGRLPVEGSPRFPESYWGMRLERYHDGRRARRRTPKEGPGRWELFDVFWDEFFAATGDERTGSATRETVSIGSGTAGALIYLRVYRGKVRISLLVTGRRRREELIRHFLRNPIVADTYGPGLCRDIKRDRKSAQLFEDRSFDIADPASRADAIVWLVERRDRLVRAVAAAGRPG